MIEEAGKIAVAVVDDEPDARFILADMLKWSGDMKCVGAFASGEAALTAVEFVKPEVVLMDIRLPGMSGIECARRLKVLLPGLVVICVTRLMDAATLNDALNARVDDCLIKPFLLTQCLTTLRFAVGRREKIPDLSDGASAPEFPKLNARQREIVSCVVDGMLNKEIAARFNMSVAMVEKLLHQIYVKLHVTNRAQAVREATKRHNERVER